MLIKQFFVGDGISHLSYLVATETKAIVIDPKRDIEDYIEEAKKLNIKIEAILITHLHADYISGHLELAKKTGAKIYLPEKSNSSIEHIPLKEGDKLEIESVRIEVLDTPGHTPEHISFVFYDLSRGEEPIAIFTGDTLFVGDVGRPDLFPNKKEELAEALYHSLQKIMKLPDFVEVYPAHSAGTLCGKALSSKRSTTIGYERKFNKLLQIKDINEFKKVLLDGMPPVPDHFKRCAGINRNGATLLEDLPKPEAIELTEFEELAKDRLIVDLRSYTAWAGGHIPNSLSFDFKSMPPSSLFAGWILPPDKEILFIADNKEDIDEATIKFRRVGIDLEIGYLDGGFNTWLKAGNKVKSYPVISVDVLDKWLKEGKEVEIIDVRNPSEFANGSIENAKNIPLPDLRYRYEELPKDKPLILVCGIGPRGSISASILESKGFENMYILAGGMTAWNNYLNKNK